MRWLRLVGSLKLWVSLANEPYERDDILQKRPIILRSVLIVVTSYLTIFQSGFCAEKGLTINRVKYLDPGWQRFNYQLLQLKILDPRNTPNRETQIPEFEESEFLDLVNLYKFKLTQNHNLFEFVPGDTEESDCLDFVEFTGVAWSLESAHYLWGILIWRQEKCTLSLAVWCE